MLRDFWVRVLSIFGIESRPRQRDFFNMEIQPEELRTNVVSYIGTFERYEQEAFATSYVSFAKRFGGWFRFSKTQFQHWFLGDFSKELDWMVQNGYFQSIQGRFSPTMAFANRIAVAYSSQK